MQMQGTQVMNAEAYLKVRHTSEAPSNAADAFFKQLPWQTSPK